MDLGNHFAGQTGAPSQTSPQASEKHAGFKKPLKMNKWLTSTLGVIVLLLVVGVVLIVGLNQPRSQTGYVDSNRLQAVFLNTGQVYFGNIKNINPQFVVLDNIFYLQTNNNNSSSSSSSSNNNVSLVKLGCELHAPYDQMVINMNQVTFWENLQTNGQVAKAVAQYQKQYPNGQTCSDQSSSSGSTTNSVQNAPANKAP